MPNGSSVCLVDSGEKIDRLVARRAVDELLDALMRHTENYSCLSHGHVGREKRRRDTAAGECCFRASDAFDHVSVVEEFLHTLQVGWEVYEYVYVDVVHVDFKKVNYQATSDILDLG